MNLAILVHIMSVFHFAGRVIPRGNGWTVLSNDGELMQVVENGVDMTEQLGGSHPLDSEPIAKQQRLFKINEKGHIVKHDQYAERVKIAKLLVDEKGVAKSISKLRDAGLETESKDKKDVDLVLNAQSLAKLAQPAEQQA